MKKILTRLALTVLFVLCLANCAGGGSAGTGTGVPGTNLGLTLEGRVLDTNSNPVPDALVVVKETGDSDITDQGGNFLIQTAEVSGDLTLEVTSNGKTNFTTITVQDGSTALHITVKINPLLDEADSSMLEVNAKIVGECDQYFENFRTIRQANPIPSKQISCTTKVRVESDGLPLAHVPIAVQFRACKKNSPWATIALGATMTGANLGTGQVPFNFSDDEKHCVYRILAPFENKNVEPIIYEVHTLTYQAFQKK